MVNSERKERRGFASMSPEKQREIASKGGRAAHEKGTAHEWTADEARSAGRRGGQVSRRLSPVAIERKYRANGSSAEFLSTSTSHSPLGCHCSPQNKPSASLRSGPRRSTVDSSALFTRNKLEASNSGNQENGVAPKVLE